MEPTPMHPEAQATPTQQMQVAEPSLSSAVPVHQSRQGEVGPKPGPTADVVARAVERRA